MLDAGKRTLAAIAAVLCLVTFAIYDDGASDSVMRLPRVADLPVRAQVGVVLDLPPEMRTKNYAGGSCVHASTINLLKWMQLDELAEWWRRSYSGGETDTRLVARMEAAGLRYAWIHGGGDLNGNGVDDGEEFLMWCVRTRRGCGIFYKPNHAINLVGLDDRYAYLLDNNATDYPEQTGRYERVPRGEFLRRWAGYGAFAWTLVYDPTPPAPYVESQR